MMGAPNTSTIVLDFMTSHADQLWTLDRLEKELSGKLTRQQISNALGHLRRNGEFPNLVSPQRGIFKWNSTPTDAQSDDITVGDDIIITVILLEQNGRMLVKHDDAGLFLMTPFELPG